jgi:hypothetical protein
MSCDVSIPSIEAHITPTHLPSKDRTHRNESHTECFHYFLEQPFVLPDSVPDALVEFPGELKIAAPPKGPSRPVIQKPPITAQPSKSPQLERNQRLRELLEDSSLLLYFKHHGSARQPLDTTIRKPLGSLQQATHQAQSPRRATDAFSRKVWRLQPQ